VTPAPDPTRLALAIASAELQVACACDPAGIVGRDERLVSHHARALRAGGPASSARDGKLVTGRGHAPPAAVTATPADA
jgi:ArsR family transcriptional regulator, lead/cadmium/zinc/bismuth-responsive transcriptional repressor